MDSNCITLIFQIISSTLSLCAVIVAIISARQSHDEYMDSVKPLLSLSLVEINHMLYVRIKNTGKSAAEHVTVSFSGISNNGDANTLILGDLFKSTFDLYPEEIVQDQIAEYGKDIFHSAFPSVTVTVAYSHAKRKSVSYQRTLTFANDVSKNPMEDAIGTLQSNLQLIGQSTCRLANYFTGDTLAYFDRIDKFPKSTFADDIAKSKKVKPRRITHLTKRNR